MVCMKRTIAATEFKAKCLGLLDEIEQDGDPIVITRRGKPVAVLGPAPKKAGKSPADSLKGKCEILGDIVNTSEDFKWEVAGDK